MTCCIYQIVNQVNGKIYVGSATNFSRRTYYHLYDLRKGKHGNKKLQNAYNKYGEQSFEFLIIEACAKKELVEREQHWIDNLKAVASGYNICPKASLPPDMTGRKLSPEHIEKLRAQKKGKKRAPFSAEWLDRMAEAARRPRPNARKQIDFICIDCGTVKRTHPSYAGLLKAKADEYKCYACYVKELKTKSEVAKSLPFPRVDVSCSVCNEIRSVRRDAVGKSRSKVCYKCSLKTRKKPEKWNSPEAYDKMMSTFATPEFKAKKKESCMRGWETRRRNGQETSIRG